MERKEQWGVDGWISEEEEAINKSPIKATILMTSDHIFSLSPRHVFLSAWHLEDCDKWEALRGVWCGILSTKKNKICQLLFSIYSNLSRQKQTCKLTYSSEDLGGLHNKDSTRVKLKQSKWEFLRSGYAFNQAASTHIISPNMQIVCVVPTAVIASSRRVEESLTQQQ